MSDHEDPYAEHVGHQLTQRADLLDDAPLTLDGVRGRARSIRRTRRLSAAASVALVATVVVPAALILGNGSSRPGDVVLPAQRPPSAIDPGPGPMGVAYLQDDVIHFPDGSARPLGGTVQDFRPQQLVTLDGDRAAVAGMLDGDAALITYDFTPQGGVHNTRTDLRDVSGGLDVSTFGHAVAWMDPDGSPRVWQDGTAKPIQLAAVGGSDPETVALLGEDCTTDPVKSDGGGCAVVANVDTQTASPGNRVSSSSRDSVGVYVPAFREVTDVSLVGNVAAGVISVDDAGSCSGLWDLGTTSMLWRTCDYGGLELSPDGEHVLASPAYVDGLGAGDAYLLDAATGERVAALVDPDPGSGLRDRVDAITHQVWEDDEHALAVVRRQGQWYVERLGLDGARETVLGPARGPDPETSPYVLP